MEFQVPEQEKERPLDICMITGVGFQDAVWFRGPGRAYFDRISGSGRYMTCEYRDYPMFNKAVVEIGTRGCILGSLLAVN